MSIVAFFFILLLKNSRTTSKLVQDLGDNIIQADGADSIVFDTSITIDDSMSMVRTMLVNV